MIETDKPSARMTVTSVMLDDDGIVLSGYLLVLTNTATMAVLAPGASSTSRYVIDVLGPLPGAGAVLLAESTLTADTDHQVVCDTVIRHESAGLPVVAVVRHYTDVD
ncbi:hypothetical protein GCM10010472_44130 [Pseudonocardia halophobica]|uniref:Uncharacterized protein n=1 Tax=Pseudonocardia halophobica TaxID=29401 RepID=A0A9W6L7Q8_9PSEU|nr:hypothetical protein [Pseudonocardia halophobica]GLL14445.1 hypothetical protein GCM10017577_55920 [Pseudonocardia halophobica]